MRLTAIGAALVVAGCAGTQTADTTQAAKRACGGTSCFFEREVRDFEVINHTTLIVYVGPQRCPYQVELNGAFCDMSYAPELYFTDTADRTDPKNHPRSNPQPGDPGSSGDAFDVVTNKANTPAFDPRLPANNLSDLRVCTNDLSIGVSGGVFTQGEVETRDSRQADCRIQSVAALTDDKLMELYVRKGVVPPPPPMGSGQIQVGAQSTPSPGGGGAGTGARPANPPQGAAPASQLTDAAR